MNASYVAIAGLCVLLAGVFFYRVYLALRSGKRGYEVGTCKTIGNREIQMDYFAVEKNDHGLLAVLADGMGKDAGGRIAAKTVVRVFVELFGEYNMLDNPSYFFRKAFLTANREILKQLDDERGKAVASTLMIRDGKLYYAIVGNVKIAVYRNGELIELGAGHTVNVLAENKYYEGVLKREDAVAMLQEKRIYNYLGRDGFGKIGFYDEPVGLKENDIVVLMSDGTYEAIGWKNMEDYLAQKKKCKKIALDMIEHINQKTEDRDNASVVLIKIGEQT